MITDVNPGAKKQCHPNATWSTTTIFCSIICVGVIYFNKKALTKSVAGDCLVCWDHNSKPSYDHTLELQLWTIFPLPLLWLDHGKVQPRVKAPTYPKNSWDKIVLICSFYSLVIIFQHICLSQVTVEISAPELTWWCDNWKGGCDLWFHSS